jgi:hypothetical protein
MAKFRVLFTCPQCGTQKPKWFAKQFAVFTFHCRCGASLTAHNPRFTPEQVLHMKRCCDCGEPIPPSISLHHHLNKIPPLSRTCPACFERHSHDEPGVDLERDLMGWLSSQVRRRSLARDRLATILIARRLGIRKEVDHD